MAKIKYRYNPQTLSYEEVELTIKDYVLKALGYVAAGLVFSLTIVIITFSFFESPNETKLRREKEELISHFRKISNRMAHIEGVVEDIQYRDDNIYRVIFEAEPVPFEKRNRGIGGNNRYKELEDLGEAKLIIESNKKADKLARKLYAQSLSFDEVAELAKNKEEMLACIPAIQPISNKDLKRMASGYGMRMHPIHRIRKMHKGMDFSSPKGTEIYATGNGKVKNVSKRRSGYGNHVIIDHGYGFETLYAHMTNFIVKKGQEVKRGQVIGYVGNTGLSVAPHLHYEVHRSGKAVNPAHYYYNDLTPEEYERMIELSSHSHRTLD